MWQYTIETDGLTLIGQHLTSKFLAGSDADEFLTQDEESSGVIDAQDILGPGMFLLVDQAHYPIPGEIVEGGQFLTMYNPTTDKSNPEIEVLGNNKNIIIGDVTPAIDDNTDFGKIKVGASISKVFQINNKGLGNLNVTQISIAGLDAKEFVLETGITLPLVIQPNTSQNISIKFTPTKLENRNAKIVLANTDFNEHEFVFSIIGEGLSGTATKNEKSSLESILITPNPMNDFVVINFKLNKSETISCNILDLNGNMVLQPFESKYFATGDNKQYINTNSLNNGMYVIELISTEFKWYNSIVKMY